MGPDVFSVRSILLFLLLSSGFDVCSGASVTAQSTNPLNILIGSTPSMIWTYSDSPSPPDIAQLVYGNSVDSNGFIQSPSQVICSFSPSGSIYPQQASYISRLVISWAGDTITIALKNVDINDTMYYAVELRKGGSPIPGMTSKGLKLFVQVPVEMIQGPLNKTSTEGGELSLECLASGHPPPKVTWTKIGEPDILFKTQNIETKELSNTVVKSTLVIKSLKRSDPGSYQCNATNGVKNPKTSRSILRLTYKSNIRTSCKHIEDYFIFLCEVIKSDSSLLEYEFNIDGENDVQLSPSPTKIFLAKNEAWWRCRAKTMEGWGDWSDVVKTEDCDKDEPTFRKQILDVEECGCDVCSCTAWKAVFGLLATIFIILAFSTLFIIYKKKILGFIKGEKYVESPRLTGDTPPPSNLRINGFTNDLNNVEMKPRHAEQKHLNDLNPIGLSGIKLGEKHQTCNIPDTVEESEWERMDPDSV